MPGKVKIDRLLTLTAVPRRYVETARQTFAKLTDAEIDARLRQLEEDNRYLVKWRAERGAAVPSPIGTPQKLPAASRNTAFSRPAFEAPLVAHYRAGPSPPVTAPNIGVQGSGAMAISWRVSGSPFTSRAEAANAIKTADLLLVIALFLIMIGGYHVHFMLTAGDWDFWIDWKDRRFWPTVLPIMLITFVAAAQYFFWEHFRLPFGATFVSLALLTGEWMKIFDNPLPIAGLVI